jgi:bifunctional non-homologous end joining protein LigD
MTAKRASKKNADIVDEQLARYRAMRDFTGTPEPAGGSAAKKKGPAKSGTKIVKDSTKAARNSASELPFVIQKHAASHLHYDFRLGWNGVLKSWAVPKGPSYSTKDKRLATQVEDHPIEYGGFEGIIPQGRYGGGTVMLWDMGIWEPQAGHTDVDAGLRDGSLKFTLHGKKMKGNWALVRMGGKAAGKQKANWLLIKEHDSFERAEGETSIEDEEPNSAATGRSMEEIAHAEDHVWNSDHPEKKKQLEKKSQLKPAGAKPVRRVVSKTHSAVGEGVAFDLKGYAKEKLPAFIPPQLAMQTEKPMEQPIDQAGWLHELKLDGYRIQARKNGSEVQLFTRTGLDWTHRMKAISAEVASLAAESAILDGEVVVLERDGTTSFAKLQAAFREGEKHTLTYFVFDLLHLNGHNLRNGELVARKALLARLLEGSHEEHPDIQLSEDISGRGKDVFEKACQLHAEGIVSKRAAGKYISGRTRDWQKTKCAYSQEFVIGGFTLPSNGIRGVGALLLGYYDGGKLIYAGRTGTGFTQKTHGMIREQLERLRVKTAPFEAMPAEARKGALWVKPKLVAEVNFATWTADDLVRQAAFKGLREDKPAKDVRREGELPVREKPIELSASHGAQSSNAAKRASKTDSVQPAKASNARSSPEHAAVRLTHPDKILDSESGLTKQQLADYYWTIAEHMLPQIANRPISLVRCPEGSTKPCFFQKHGNAMLPQGIETVNVPDKKTGKLEPYITIATRESLAEVAQMGVLEIHPWGSRNDDLEHPDRIIIDLDPDEAISWRTLAEAATETREVWKKLGFESFLKSTGGKGLHVVVPIEPKQDWAAVKQLAHAVALKLEKQKPELYLTKMSKAARKGKIFVDYLRNERGATAVAAFSPRARAGAPVSMPLSWSELADSKRPAFHVGDFEDWKGRLKRDPWKKLPLLKQAVEHSELAASR